MPRFSHPRFATRAFWADRAAWTARAYDLQQRLALTTTEATALLTLAGLLALGTGVRAWQAQQIPFDDAFYAETDATFAALSGAPGTVRLATAPVRTVPDTTEQTSDTTTDGSALDGSNSDEVAADSTPEASDSPPPPRSTRAVAGPVRMNVNTASTRLLDRLPGIGPALAERIVVHRAERGPFRRAEDLVDVRGIGPKTFERMAPYVFVENAVQDASAVAANTDSE